MKLLFLLPYLKLCAQTVHNFFCVISLQNTCAVYKEEKKMLIAQMMCPYREQYAFIRPTNIFCSIVYAEEKRHTNY